MNKFNSNIQEILQNKNVLMLAVTLSYIVGILSCFYGHGIFSAAVFTILTAFLTFKNNLSIVKSSVLLIFFYFGFFNTYIQIKPIDEIYPLAPADTMIAGQIVSIPNSNDRTKAKFFVNVNKVGDKNIKGKIFVTAYDETGNFSNYKIGNSYEFNGKLRIPFKASNPSQFDYGKYLRNFHAYTVFYTGNDGKLINKNLSGYWKFLQNLNDKRGKILSIHSSFLKSPNLEILGGVVFGDDAVAPPDYVKSAFIQSGLLHILAASGMNVAFIFGFWFFILFKILRFPYKFTILSGMGVVILYTMMTGLGASVIRAALMLLFVLAGKLIDRDAHSVSLLSFVALLMLIYNPAFINDVGFQLSFLVTLGLLTTANSIFEKIQSKNKVINWLAGTMLIPIVAQIWVAPIQMFYFNTFCLYSIFANILSVPFLAVISFGGFTSSILALFSPLTLKICGIIDWILNINISILLKISNLFAELPHSLLTTTHPALWQVALYLAIIVFVTGMIKFGTNKKRLAILILAVLILAGSQIKIPHKNLEIIAFDVKNADCFLIKSPDNKYFIIDTGKSGYNGGNSQAKIILLKYLKDRGIKNIEGLIITHFDNDHSGGAVDILENLKVQNTYINTFYNKSSTSFNIYKTLKENKIPAKLAKNNETIYTNGDFNVKTYFADIKRKDSDNENSIVTLISYKDFDMLFMGDGTIETFESIKQNLPSNIEVLKVGHHGAKGVVNPEFLSHINSKVSIISTGENKFGHPTIGTLDVLRKTDIYRTDKHNALKISTDGNKYYVYGYNPLKHEFEKINDYETIKPEL
ncbi:DNA internalization-related competence protein ComEC/Rec2 [bacterium]|nr:DNA internalization-related competence protein ComEC/Rec2 [bacterium]